MRRWINGLLVVCFTVGLGSCADGDPALAIQFHGVPDANCLLSESTDTFRPFGVYDLRAVGPYVFSGIVAAQLQSRASDVQIDPNALYLEGYEVELQDLDGNRLEFAGLENPYFVRTTGVIEPVTSPGSVALGIATATIIRDSYQSTLLSFLSPGSGQLYSIIAELRVSGETQGGIRTTSRPFRYPIELCYGCLDDCNRAGEGACLPGQDDYYYCSSMATP